MPHPFPPGLSHIATALADGEPVDWPTLESAAWSDEEKQYLARLKTVAAVAQLHATGQFSGSGLTSIARSELSLRESPIYAAGSFWGHLKIVELVGQGRYGVVYRAWDPKLEREVALKILRHRQIVEESEVVHEARMMARVHHPNVVAVYGADSHDGQTGIWMQFIQGRTLEAELLAEGRFSIEKLTTVGSQLCGALSAVHQAGLLHRDVKPQNVMRDQNGRVVLGDFGTGRLTGEDLGGLAGTPMYLAPESVGGADASERSDIYALGVMLFHLATGTYPVVARSIAEFREAHASAPRQKLAALRPDLDGPVAIAIERAIATDPDERWDSAEAMQAALSQTPTLMLAWWRTPPAAVAAIVITLAAIAASIWTPRSIDSTRSAAPDAPAERPWVLLASSVNDTGNSELDRVLEHALERELIRSSQFHVASRPRVDDVLRLMRRPAESRLDESSAREVALRDGGITTVIGSRLERLGVTTVVSASLIDVASGTTRTHFGEEAATPADLQAAIRRLSDRLRAALGETDSSIRQSAQQLERVTTPSLKALRLYSEAYAAGSRDQWPAALNLAREAINEDPTFAAAHTWLAWAQFRNQLPSQVYLSSASTAVTLSANASEWERLWIQASFHGLNNDNSAARGALEALLRLYPDHVWGTNNLVIIHTRAGRDVDALPLATRLAELRPRDYSSLLLAFDTHRRLGILNKASDYADRIKAVGVYNRRPGGDPWVFGAVVAWHNGNPRALVQELRRVQSEALSLDGELRDAVLARVAMLWLAAGRPLDAEQALQPTTNAADSQLARAAIAHSVHDLATARREALATKVQDVAAGGTNASENNQWALAMWLIARSAKTNEAKTYYSEVAPKAQKRAPPQGPATLNILTAESALAEGRTSEVITRLAPQSAWNNLPDAINFRAAETLVEALAGRGDNGEAVKALEHAMASRHIGASDGAYWQMRCQVRLAELYQLLGRRDDSVKLASTLAGLLSEAEPGFPMANRVRALVASAR